MNKIHKLFSVFVLAISMTFSSLVVEAVAEGQIAQTMAGWQAQEGREFVEYFPEETGTLNYLGMNLEQLMANMTIDGVAVNPLVSESCQLVALYSNNEKAIVNEGLVTYVFVEDNGNRRILENVGQGADGMIDFTDTHNPTLIEAFTDWLSEGQTATTSEQAGLMAMLEGRDLDLTSAEVGEFIKLKYFPEQDDLKIDLGKQEIPGHKEGEIGTMILENPVDGYYSFNYMMGGIGTSFNIFKASGLIYVIHRRANQYSYEVYDAVTYKTKGSQSLTEEEMTSLKTWDN